MKKFEVRMFFGFSDESENVWTETDADGNEKPVVFDTREEAQAELDKFIAETEEAVALGHMQEAYEHDDFEIVETTEEN